MLWLLVKVAFALTPPVIAVLLFVLAVWPMPKVKPARLSPVPASVVENGPVIERTPDAVTAPPSEIGPAAALTLWPTSAIGVLIACVFVLLLVMAPVSVKELPAMV